MRLVQPWSLRYPLALGQGNFGSPGNDGAAAHRYTETKMAPLAMEMVRDIDEDTVDFQDNYDGRTQEPAVLPARFPNLLVNGSVGIAVGMATNIPPHNLREVSDAALWALENPDATREELLEAIIARVKGPDFPTGAQILGVKGIQDAYRTGRGSITMRAVVNVEEIQGRTCLVVTELPYQVNPDNLAIKIADLVKEGKLAGIADIRDETSGRTGQRLVIVLKRDAVAKVVLNNLYKHTQLQENFGANMLAIVDGVPRTLPIDGFITPLDRPPDRGHRPAHTFPTGSKSGGGGGGGGGGGTFSICSVIIFRDLFNEPIHLSSCIWYRACFWHCRDSCKTAFCGCFRPRFNCFLFLSARLTQVNM